MTKAKSKPQPAAKSKVAKKIAKPKRVRLSPDDRTSQILAGAIAYFAERGFGGQTRELTTRLGISTGLLYRYFPCKDALIDRIYGEVFMGRWSSDWDELLADRSKPVVDRLRTFYLEYAKRMLHDYEWVRIYLLSGLAGASINRKFSAFVTEHVFKPVIREIRAELNLPDPDASPITESEMELIWGLHGAIFYIGIRKWVYHTQVPRDVEAAVVQLVDGYCENACRLKIKGAG